MHHRYKGYTLIETIIYVAILAIVAVIALSSVLGTYQSFDKTQILRKLSSGGETAMERMIREIRIASSANIGSSVFKTNPGTLVIGAKTFSVSGGVIELHDGANPAEPLTASDVNVSSLVFYIATTTNSGIIKIEMTLEGGSGNLHVSKNFFGSAVMRGGYQ